MYYSRSAKWIFYETTFLPKQWKIEYITGLPGHFAPILYFICEHFLFVFIIKQKQTKTFGDFIKKCRGYSEIEFCKRFIFENSIVHKPSLGSPRAPQKIWPKRFGRFDVYCTPRHPGKLYIDIVKPMEVITKTIILYYKSLISM